MMDVIGQSLIISLAINGAMFVVAYRLKSDKLTDASYAVSFIALVLFALGHSGDNSYSLIGAALIIIWAVRIGSFLLYRVIKSGKDARFDGTREHFIKFGKFWLWQALTVWILMIPVTLALTDRSVWGVLAIVGIAIWLFGLVFESIADLQKYRFTHNLEHKNHWIDSGVWRYSRHPNYFGEILVWIGIYLFAVPSLSPLGTIIGLISPLFIAGLLLFGSGVPILEKSADKRWGSDPAYRSYKRHTSLLIPLPAGRKTSVNPIH